MKSALNLIFLESGSVEYSIVGKEINGCSVIPGLALRRKKSVNKFNDRFALLIAVFVNVPVSFDCDIESGRQCVYNG